MKKANLILGVLLLLVSAAKSQHMMLAPTIEKTVAGSQYGLQLFFQTKRSLHFGVFYQASLQQNQEGLQTANPFYGVTLNVPLVKSEKVNLYVNTRCGVVNQLFVVVVPGLETEVMLSKAFSISALTSIRMSYPSAMLKVNIKL